MRVLRTSLPASSRMVLRRAGKRPQANALLVHTKQIGDQHCGRPIGEAGRRHPGAAHILPIEWITERKRPPLFQIMNNVRQSR